MLDLVSKLYLVESSITRVAIIDEDEQTEEDSLTFTVIVRNNQDALTSAFIDSSEIAVECIFLRN